TDLGNPDDPAELRRLNWPSVGCVLVEREVSARPMIVGEVRGQDASQMPFAENDDMLQALAAHRADEPLDERVLPGAVRRREDFTDPHRFHSPPKPLAVDGVKSARALGLTIPSSVLARADESYSVTERPVNRMGRPSLFQHQGDTTVPGPEL